MKFLRLGGPRTRPYLIAAGVGILVFVLFFLAPEFLKAFEIKLYDLHFTFRGKRPAGDQVVIVAVDEKSVGEIGRWPWPRSVLAKLVGALSDGGAKVIALDILLSEPETSGERRAADQLSGRLDALGLSTSHAAGRAVRQELETLVRRTDHDAQLEESLRRSGRVVLPLNFEIKAGVPDSTPQPVGSPFKSALVSFRHYDERGVYPPLSAIDASAPIPRLSAAARELGHVTMIADPDGTTRWEALIFEHKGYYYPSLGVQAARLALGVDGAGLKLDFGHVLEVGAIQVPLDPRNRMLIDYAGPAGTFRTLSAADVVAGRIPAGAVKDRIVFVGASAAGIYDLRVTPLTPVLPGVEKHANVAGNILDGRFLRRPDWVELIEGFGILFWPALLAWLLPRLRPMLSLLSVLALWGAFFAIVHLAFLRGLWLPLVYPSLAMALTFVGITVYRLFTEERQRLWIKRAFQRFVSPEVVERLVDNPGALQFGGEVRNLTVLFTDIRDFTTYSERHPPQEVVQTLREYLTTMADQVINHQGTLDKFIGDAVMAIFGAPVAQPDHAERACRAALAMIAELEKLQAKWVAEGREPFRMGIGINTGEMVVGNLGSEQLFDYTVVGDGVNVGARLESLNKEYKTDKPIIISESTYEAARDVLEVRRLGEVVVKGKTRPVVAYELQGIRDVSQGSGQGALTNA
ncbi:MAG TPA: CHASE2 domain-containing protein [Methylomirabilota bacterium]|jgi:adenylate cyclase|nr:CHASE2 domain-containing protein [Methylomirabilota bacterium]